MSGIRSLAARAYAGAWQPWDAAGLAAFRFVYGLVMAVSLTRFQAFGWVHELYVRPTFFFKFWGFEWVKPASPTVLAGLHVALTALALFVAVGFLYRLSIVLFLVGFAYLQLLDVTNYLNHYYLAGLLALLLACLPLGRAYSVDARLWPQRRVETFPAFYTFIVRFQVGVVYFFAGLAKAGTDWLLHAQPLNIWLSARTSTPIVGPWLDERAVAYAMSWGGFLFDTSIPFFLAWKRTRPWAYLVVIFFHVATQTLFPIGMFPTIMITSALIFFSPSWPRRVLAFFGVHRELGAPALGTEPAPARRWAMAAFAAYALFQLVMPLRHWLYRGNVLWDEQGMRFSWRVMLREKDGAIDYLVEEPASGQVVHVNPRRYLTDRQLRDFSSQPDLVLQLAHHIHDDFQARGHGDVRVRVEARVSLNGRKPELMIDPEIDLAHVEDGLCKASWIRPAPTTDPIHLRPIAWAF
jgi:vitamin K-dependent gamma-carboxylase